MKIIRIVAIGVACLLVASAGIAADAPRELAGYVLGRPLAEFKDRVIMETALPVRYSETFKEVEIVPLEGFKSGLIGYGTCHQDGQILRIKLKYKDSSKAFFKKLLKQFKKRFGDPTEYNGDAFQVFISWKWSFVDSDGQRVSLTLQHNQSDSDEKIGNAVKLTHTGMVNQEMDCFRARASEKRDQMRKMLPIESKVQGWDQFVPK